MSYFDNYASILAFCASCYMRRIIPWTENCWNVLVPSYENTRAHFIQRDGNVTTMMWYKIIGTSQERDNMRELHGTYMDQQSVLYPGSLKVMKIDDAKDGNLKITFYTDEFYLKNHEMGKKWIIGKFRGYETGYFRIHECTNSDECLKFKISDTKMRGETFALDGQFVPMKPVVFYDPRLKTNK
jgi:hypothetical protein